MTLPTPVPADLDAFDELVADCVDLTAALVALPHHPVVLALPSPRRRIDLTCCALLVEGWTEYGA